MANNLKIIRFLGEEIIGEILDDTKDFIKVKNPVRIVVVPSKSDPKNPSVAFAPYCEWTDDKEFTISKNYVITIMNPLPVFINQYNSSFGGVIVPDTKIIT